MSLTGVMMSLILHRFSRWQQQKLGPVLIPPPPSAEDVGQNGFHNPYDVGVCLSLFVVDA